MNVREIGKLFKPANMKWKMAFIGSFLTLATLCVHAKDDVDGCTLSKYEVGGSVFQTDKRKPLRDVTVTAYSASKKEMAVTTDAQGNYYFDGLKPGTYRFVVEREGYRKVIKEKVSVRTDEGFQLNIDMTEESEFSWLPGSFQFMGGER